jgi:hypothetical protein
MALGLNFGTGADNDGETLFSAFTKINTILSTTTKLSNGDLQLNGVTIGKGNNTVSSNLVIGENAGNAITTGYQNLFIGSNSGKSTTTGFANAFIGLSAGEFNSTGVYNLFLGVNAGRYNNSTSNTLLGQGAGENSLGQGNTFVGQASNSSGTAGSYGTFVGQSAGFNNNGQSNTFVGQSSGYSNNTGFYHTFLGQNSGYNQSSGTGNTFLGFSAGTSSTSYSNATAVGNNAQPNASDTVTLGNGSIAALRCQVTVITGLSDARDKTDIIEISEGLEFVDKLKPVTFTWNQRDGNRIGAKASGFIAQDLLELQSESSIGENLDLVSEANPERLEARYSNLLPVLVKAIQELSLEVKSLKSEIELLKAI